MSKSPTGFPASGEGVSASEARSSDREPHVGGIDLVLGCMFSGKTTQLLRRLQACAPRQAMAFKHLRDTRGEGNQIVSHAGLRFPARVIRASTSMLDEAIGSGSVIGIDEAHFFDAELPRVCGELRSRNILVLLTGLDRTSWGRPFAVIEALRRVADRVHIMTATCARCGGVGAYTQRLTPVAAGGIVGGAEAFEPRCGVCWRPPPEAPLAPD